MCLSLAFVSPSLEQVRLVIKALPPGAITKGPLKEPIEQGLYFENEKYKHLGPNGDDQSDQDTPGATIIFGETNHEGRETNHEGHVDIPMGERTGIELRGLMLKQPWLNRILYNGKDVENRSRSIGPFKEVRAWCVCRAPR